MKKVILSAVCLASFLIMAGEPEGEISFAQYAMMKTSAMVAFIVTVRKIDKSIGEGEEKEN